MTHQNGQNYHFDILVIGSGLAGMHYALQILKMQPHLKIALISKTELTECNSRYAQGGIAAVINPHDSVEKHIQDTIESGAGLCFEPHVACIIQQGAQAIHDVQQDYHIHFDTDTNGDYILAQEGGHQHRRILNCGDKTGKNVIEKLATQIKSKTNITVFEHHIAVNLIVYQPPYRIDIQGEVLGAYVLDEKSMRIHSFRANVVVLATGGSGKIYRYTSNPEIATGDGIAMAYRAGARISNMEFYQFHPTLLHHPNCNDFLISEAVRGEGALLKNADSGQCFMQNYAPKHKELATRDIVARAIFSEIEISKNQFVYLDITHKTKTFLQQRFPHIFHTLKNLGIDMSQDYIPVVPGAHYQCGGIITDIDGRTDLKRLYAIGEVSCTGLHGANRLASNSLLEALVMAKNSAHASLLEACKPISYKAQIEPWRSPTNFNMRRASQINTHWNSLRHEMTAYAGIIRTQEGLEDLLKIVKIRRKIVEEYYWNHLITKDLIELRNIICVAELIVKAALHRRESRGTHFREDYPDTDINPQNSIERMMYPESKLIDQ